MPRRVYAYARNVLGRRGSLLTILGLAWMAMGLAVPFRAEEGHLVLLNVLAPLRATLWVVTGAVAVVVARRREDRAGWLALYLMAAYRAVAFSAGAVAVALDGVSAADLPVLADDVSRAVTWVAVLAAIRICSGWREHPEDLTTGALQIVAAPAGDDEVAQEGEA